MMVGAVLGSMLNWILVRPIRVIGRFLLRHVFIHAYSLYRTVKNRLDIVFAPAKNKIIYPLLNKSSIHAIIAFLAVAVIVNNFVIKETRAEEFGRDLLLGAMTTNIQDVEITETAIQDTYSTPDYFRITGTVTPLNSGTPTAADTGTSALLASSGALVNPNLSSTTVGDRPRESVVYYTVEGGDTISVIAEKFGISTDTILWENRLGARDVIKPGNKLTILPISGVSHQVKKSETLEAIAKKYKADVNEIIEYNALVDATDIDIDQILIIPGGEVEPPKVPTITSPRGSSFAGGPIPPSSTQGGSSGKLLWPTTGHRVSQYFKWGHTGLDITGPYTAPTYAADDGRVEAVGWGSGYGNRIIINHGNGIKTLYAHHSKMFVSVGDSVSRGQTIGMIGCTGWCTGPHVHFEVIVNGVQVNPLSYL